VVTFGYVAQRYLGDFVPLMVLLGALGLHVVLSWAARADTRRRRGVGVAVGLATLVAIWFGVGLAVFFQQISTTGTDELRAFVRTQFAVQRLVPGGAPELSRVRHLPARASLGTVAVLGDCRGVFVWTGGSWRALERTERAGLHRLRVSFPPSEPGARTFAPLLRAGSPNAPMLFFVESRPGNRRVFSYLRPDGLTDRGDPVKVGPGPHRVDLVLDRQGQEIGVAVDDTIVLGARPSPTGSAIVGPVGEVVIGDGGGLPPAPGRFPGAVETVAVRPTLCREITAG
jgi:hypothetical protein